MVDASFWRNEAALANCVFGSGLKRSLSAEVGARMYRASVVAAISLTSAARVSLALIAA